MKKIGLGLGLYLVFSMAVMGTARAAKYTAESAADVSTQMALTEVELPTRHHWSPWSVSWFNWATQSMSDTTEGVGRLTSYNYLSINYRLNGATLSVRPEFYVNGAGRDYDKYGNMGIVDSEFSTGNLYFQYSKYNLALLPGGIGMTGAVRYYLPTSETDKNKKALGQIRGKFYFNRPWGRGWNSTLMMEPRYYMYSERGYIKDKGGYKSLRTNKWGQLKYYFEQSYLINAHYGFSAQTGMNHEWYYSARSNDYGSRPNNIREHWENAFYFLFNMDGVMMKAGLQQDRDIRTPNAPYNSGERFSLFNPKETSYSIMTYVRM